MAPHPPFQLRLGDCPPSLRILPPQGGKGYAGRMSSYETILFSLDNSIARLTLNRPDRLNSFTVRMHEEVADALGKLGDARVLVITGAGDRKSTRLNSSH